MSYRLSKWVAVPNSIENPAGPNPRATEFTIYDEHHAVAKVSLDTSMEDDVGYEGDGPYQKDYDRTVQSMALGPKALESLRELLDVIDGKTIDSDMRNMAIANARAVVEAQDETVSAFVGFVREDDFQ